MLISDIVHDDEEHSKWNMLHNRTVSLSVLTVSERTSRLPQLLPIIKKENRRGNHRDLLGKWPSKWST